MKLLGWLKKHRRLIQNSRIWPMKRIQRSRIISKTRPGSLYDASLKDSYAPKLFRESEDLATERRDSSQRAEKHQGPTLKLCVDFKEINTVLVASMRHIEALVQICHSNAHRSHRAHRIDTLERLAGTTCAVWQKCTRAVVCGKEPDCSSRHDKEGLDGRK